MPIKYILAKLAEKITGRKCNRCENNRHGRCRHPVPGAFDLCWKSLSRPGFEPRRPLGPSLTDEEQHQLQKIRGILDEAEDTARESGLLED